MVRIVGYTLLIISCLLFLLILVIPWIGFTKGKIVGITTGLIIAGEVLFYLSLIILGKSFYNKMKSKLLFWKTKPVIPDEPEQGKTSPNPPNGI